MREREREFRDFNKLEKDQLRVFEKTIATRQNRAGVIREIDNIRPSNKFSMSKYGEGQLALVSSTMDDTKEG